MKIILPFLLCAGDCNQSDQSPDINRESKLKPSLCICCHSIVETGLNAKVKVHPGYEYCQHIDSVFTCTMLAKSIIIPVATRWTGRQQGLFQQRQKGEPELSRYWSRHDIWNNRV